MLKKLILTAITLLVMTGTVHAIPGEGHGIGLRTATTTNIDDTGK